MSVTFVDFRLKEQLCCLSSQYLLNPQWLYANNSNKPDRDKAIIK